MPTMRLFRPFSGIYGLRHDQSGTTFSVSLHKEFCTTSKIKSNVIHSCIMWGNDTTIHNSFTYCNILFIWCTYVCNTCILYNTHTAIVHTSHNAMHMPTQCGAITQPLRTSTFALSGWTLKPAWVQTNPYHTFTQRLQIKSYSTCTKIHC